MSLGDEETARLRAEVAGLEARLTTAETAHAATLAAMIERLRAAVVVADGNTETSECYCEVRLCGYVCWSMGGQNATVPDKAEAAAEKLRQGLVTLALGYQK